MVRFAFIILLMAAAAPAQVQFGAGVKGGLATPGWYQNQSGSDEVSDDSSGFTGGPFAEIRFLDIFSIEADALYRSIGREAHGGTTVTFTENEKGSLWSFPVLAKYRFGQVRKFRPFVAAGPSFYRLSSDVKFTRESIITGPDGEPVIVRNTGAEEVRHSGTGFTVAGGIERLIAPVRVTFEGRFTAWPGNDSACGFACRESKQFQLLFGLGF